MSKLKRGILVVAALVPLALTGVWLAPYAIGDGDSYDDSTRTVTVDIKKKTQHKKTPASKSDTSKCPPSGGKSTEAVYCPPDDSGGIRDAVQVEDTVRQAVAQLQLPANTPVFGPSPDQNQWGMVPVGYPIWLWSGDTTTTMRRAVTHDGLSIDLTASRTSVTFTMGDGHTVTCTAFTKRPSPLTGDPMRVSPNCGYVYSATGRYTVTATAHWQIRWVADGQSGTLSVANTVAAASPMVIGELRTVITGGR